MDMDMETNQLSVTISAKEGEKLTFEELTQASDDVIQRISKNQRNQDGRSDGWWRFHDESDGWRK